jgi:hypothetical protein
MTVNNKPAQHVPSSVTSSVNRDSPAYHRSIKGVSQPGHKFKVGQTLSFSPSAFDAAARKGQYRVVSLLPAEGGDNQYRIKNTLDSHERVVKESQLTLA